MSVPASPRGNKGYKATRAQQAQPKIEKFTLPAKITDIEDDSLGVALSPKEGDVVVAVDSNGAKVKIELIKEVASGGEGAVYSTNCDLAVKIYKPDKLTRRRYEKIRLMLQKKIEHKGICYPVAALYNQSEQFVGYLMPKAAGVELARLVFLPPLLQKLFPDWKKRDTVQLCITILEAISYLRQRNIIMGDINPSNILVVSPNEVYFVDTDSYQIEDLPCHVGTITFTASELQENITATFCELSGTSILPLRL
jgi:DNA-binding helix-hairpin-helix protein with protein kinase domain